MSLPLLATLVPAPYSNMSESHHIELNNTQPEDPPPAYVSSFEWDQKYNSGTSAGAVVQPINRRELTPPTYGSVSAMSTTGPVRRVSSSSGNINERARPVAGRHRPVVRPARRGPVVSFGSEPKDILLTIIIKTFTLCGLIIIIKGLFSTTNFAPRRVLRGGMRFWTEPQS